MIPFSKPIYSKCRILPSYTSKYTNLPLHLIQYTIFTPGLYTNILLLSKSNKNIETQLQITYES